MKRTAFALMVHGRPEPCQALKTVLRRLGVDTYSVSGCADAQLLLEQTHPHLIFSDTQLPDGTWIDLINMVEDTAVPTCVIMVGPSKDPKMLQTTTHYGAFSFIAPPFDAERLSELLTQAMAIVRAGRERLFRSAVA